MRLHIHFLVFLLLSSFGCDEKQNLHAVTVADFSKFIESTGYVTDAETYGWSIVQKTIHHFEIVDSADWRRPNGIDSSLLNMSVTQVSYNDAIAYCEWAHVSLPSYEEYWKLTKRDNRKIVMNASVMESPENVNIVGNTWDITNTLNSRGEVRLAGGSYLCSKASCDGTNPERRLFVSTDTGNSHISFSIIPGSR